MSTLQYKGYIAEIEVDADCGVIHGSVLNTQAVLTFEADAVSDLKRAFADTVEDYLAWCRERDVAPEKPFSGTLSLRVGPVLHRAVAVAARKAHLSINSFIVQALDTAVRDPSTAKMQMEYAKVVQAQSWIAFRDSRVDPALGMVRTAGSADYVIERPKMFEIQ